MHYIIGTQLAFNKTQPAIGATSTTKINSKPKEFEFGKIYTLYNIRRTPGIVENEILTYMFTGTGNDIIEKEFASISEADQWISKARNETLPDYQSIYTRNRS